MTIEQVTGVPDTMVEAKEALAVLGLAGSVELNARRFARSGGRVGMPAVYTGGCWLVSRDALEVLIARRRTGG